MARKVQVLLVDDLDGTELGENGETVAFGMGGERYEIDLSPANAEKFRNTLGQYVSAARNVTRVGSRGHGRRSSGGSSRPRMDRDQSAAIRAWARGNGWPELGDRGRIPAEVVDAYETRTPRASQPMIEMPTEPLKDGQHRVEQAAKADRKSTKAEKAEPKVMASATS